jgi:Transposase IS66 family
MCPPAHCHELPQDKVIDTEKAAPEIAQEAIVMVRALYAVEKQGRNASIEERLRLRQEQSAPVLAELHEKFFDWKEQLLPKHPMAEAVHYALGHWEELNVFLSDGAVEIDNNISEREMKRVVLTRKNSLFVGNARGGRTAAILASFTSTCRRHDTQAHVDQLDLFHSYFQREGLTDGRESDDDPTLAVEFRDDATNSIENPASDAHIRADRQSGMRPQQITLRKSKANPLDFVAAYCVASVPAQQM